MLKRERAIFLNGPSSSGKSSIAQLLQARLPEPYLHIGIDNLISMVPAHLNKIGEQCPEELKLFQV